MSRTQPSARRIVIDTASAGNSLNRRSHRQAPRGRETWVASTMGENSSDGTSTSDGSRPNDPMSSTVAPQQTIPQASIAMQSSPSPKTSPSPSPESTRTAAATPEATGQTTQTQPDDATIQSQIERVLADDAALAPLDISTIVESGRVTIVGSVTSIEVKQKVARAIRSVKGVTGLDNQLVIEQPSP